MADEQPPPPVAPTPPVPPAAEPALTPPASAPPWTAPPASAPPWPAAPAWPVAPGDVWAVDADGRPIGPPAEPKPRRGRRLMMIIGAAVVVLAAAGVGAVVLLKQPTGEEAVRAYFEKLAAGDAEGALTHVLPPGYGSYGSQPLLSAEAIADPDSRPTGLTVVERQPTALNNGDVRERVTVTYTVRGIEYRYTVRTRQEAKGQPFLLESPFFELSVDGLAESAYVVNGVPIEHAPNPLLAFPVAHTATVEATDLFAAQSAPATRDGDELPAPATITFTLTLAPGAKDAVQAAVNEYLDGCLLYHTLDPMTRNADGLMTPCPFGLRGDETVSVEWSIARYPDITVRPSRLLPETVEITTAAEGLVRYDLPPGWVDGDFEFGVDGLAFVEGGIVKVHTNYTH